MLKFVALLVIFVATIGVALAQQNAPFRYSQCPDPAVCCLVPAPRMTQPVPGSTPTTVPESAVNLFGVHVSNMNRPRAVAPLAGSAATPAPRQPEPEVDDGGRYLQFFDTITEPHVGTVPIGSSSWFIPSQKDRDLDVGSGGGGSGWAFEQGIMACCSTDQGKFEPSGGCGYLLQYY